MAKSPARRYGGFQSENDDRVAVAGKSALITEIVHVVPATDVVTLYNNSATAYTGLPVTHTTGAAILKEIRHVMHIAVTPFMVTGAPTTTTAIRPAVVTYINGPTTLATIYTKGVPQAGGSGVSVIVFGKSF